MSYLFSKFQVNVMKKIFAIVPKPTPVAYIGSGYINKVGEILNMSSSKKVLVITGSYLLKNGMLDNMLSSIKAVGIEVVIYSGIKPDPTFEAVDEAIEACAGCDTIIAIGGGSVLDASKVVACAYTNNKSAMDLEGLFKVKNKALRLIAVPTTAGSGSETTIAAVISDNRTHKKTTVVDPKTVPQIAILDSELTINLPIDTTVYTTMDALTHALEAYVSTYRTPETDEYATTAIKTIYDNLKQVYDNPTNTEARERLLVASFYAGMAFTRTFVGYVHAFSHSIGGKFGVSHGLGNAVLLPHIMNFYKPACEKRFAQLAELVGVCSASDTTKQKCDKFIESIYDMNKALNVPTILDDFDPAAINDVIKEGFKEAHGTYPLPKYLSKENAVEILKSVARRA